MTNKMKYLYAKKNGMVLIEDIFIAMGAAHISISLYALNYIKSNGDLVAKIETGVIVTLNGCYLNIHFALVIYSLIRPEEN